MTLPPGDDASMTPTVLVRRVIASPPTTRTRHRFAYRP